MARRAIAVPSHVWTMIPWRDLGVAAGVLVLIVVGLTPTAMRGPKAASATSVPAAPPSDPDRPARTSSGQVHPSADARQAPALGPFPAKVVVVVFGDFQCPVCARVTDATHQIAEEWPGEVRVEFYQHPLAMHANAENAAVASLAAHRQGRFWQMHDALFAHQGALDPGSLAAYAREIGLDGDRFTHDYRDPALRARVRREGALAERLGAAGAPAFLINGNVQVGWGSWQGFRSQVERELAAMNALLAKGVTIADAHAARAKELAKDADAFAAYEEGIVRPLTRTTGSGDVR